MALFIRWYLLLKRLGMACRLFFDTGLSINSAALGLGEQDVCLRRKVASATLITDKYEAKANPATGSELNADYAFRYWALFMGRPTIIKNADLESPNSSNSFHQFAYRDHQSKVPSESLIYEHLSGLFEIGGHIADSHARRTRHVDSSAYATMSFLEGQLARWHAELPDCLTWQSPNIKIAPRSFFLMQ